MARSYAQEGCALAIRNPGRWVTISGINRADDARRRILRVTAPRALRRTGMPGRILVYEWRNHTVRLLYVWPWSPAAKDASLIALDKIRMDVMNPRPKNGKAPRRTATVPPQEGTQTPEGEDHATRLEVVVK